MRKATTHGFKARYLYIRGDGNYLYRRAIPPGYRILANRRSEFKESLRTKDYNVAIVRYGETHSKYEAIFDQLRRGIALKDQKAPTLDELKSKAASYGLLYKSIDAHISKPDLKDIAARIGKWRELGEPTGPEMDAIFGSLPDETTLRQVLTFYEEQNRGDLIGLTSREVSKKLTPVRSAVDRFVTFAKADIPLKNINKGMVNAYRSHLIHQIETGSIQANTANKLLMHVRKIITFYINNMDTDYSNPFLGIRLKEEKAARPAFTVTFIKTKWLSGNHFTSLNEEARGALFAMIDTGCGPKEVCGLAPEDIHVEAEIPHIIVRQNQYRSLKTAHRGRIIPLVGQSLLAFQKNPNGFPSYRRPTGQDALSGVIMKHLRSNNLLETTGHTVYSLRHLFMDRMRKHQLPEELQSYLMGHKHPTMGAHYGSGYETSHVLSYMKKLELDWK
ncbi:integrase [Aquamicrobium lusatiense]|uniref:Integrase n=1 Tax=Aquamicrobium lusatiense TaxID=89772 RepID=A0A7W9RYG2_9HYPH|nr:DUF6538 domain-containing protein [Aquamicrobium lusatiense]MBB6010806.1 integrase [Aquamicrobium lusatiense]